MRGCGIWNCGWVFAYSSATEPIVSDRVSGAHQPHLLTSQYMYSGLVLILLCLVFLGMGNGESRME